MRDLINGFSNTLDKFSQVDDIITRLCDTPKDTLTELRYIGNNILRLSDEENDSKRRKLTFIGKQLISLTVGKHGKRYTAESMTDAINLYLRSRSSYRALRELLDLPHRNTIYEYFGKLGLAGSLDECERTVKRVFESLNEGERNCFITFGEIHIKPGLYYQGRYVLGDALNQDSPCPATTMLALMLNPFFGAPAFIGRLIPVHKLCSEFLYEQLVQLLHCIHNNGGLVYAMMSDNLRVNQKVFKSFHQNFTSLNIYSVTHPIPSLVYTL